MDFEWDMQKNKINLEKHGITLEEAQKVFLDPERISGPGDVVERETRWLTVGQINEELWTVCWTERGEKTRLISARRAREEEKQAYGKN